MRRSMLSFRTKMHGMDRVIHGGRAQKPLSNCDTRVVDVFGFRTFFFDNLMTHTFLLDVLNFGMTRGAQTDALSR
jgi:hypothetical protein